MIKRYTSKNCEYSYTHKQLSEEKFLSRKEKIMNLNEIKMLEQPLHAALNLVISGPELAKQYLRKVLLILYNHKMSCTEDNLATLKFERKELEESFNAQEEAWKTKSKE